MSAENTQKEIIVTDAAPDKDAPKTSLRDDLVKAYEAQTGEKVEPKASTVGEDIDDAIVDDLRKQHKIELPEPEKVEANTEKTPKVVEPPAWMKDWAEEERGLMAGLKPETLSLLEKKMADQPSASMGRDIDKLFEPWKASLAENKMTPQTVVKGWMDLYNMSVKDPKGYAKHMVKSLGVNPADLMDAPAKVEPKVEPKAKEDDDPFADPEIKTLKAKIAELEGKIAKPAAVETQPEAQTLTSEQIAQQAVWQDRVERFKDEKGADGKPLRPHFASLQLEMSALAQTWRQQGKPIDLQAMYDTAVGMNKEISALVNADKTKEAESRKSAEKKAALEKAKRASSSVRTDEKATDRPKGIDDLTGREKTRAIAKSFGMIQ